MIGHAGAQLVLQTREIGHALIDLDEEIGARAIDILVTELDDHLCDAANGSHHVDRIAFTRRVGVTAHDS